MVLYESCPSLTPNPSSLDSDRSPHRDYLPTESPRAPAPLLLGSLDLTLSSLTLPFQCSLTVRSGKGPQAQPRSSGDPHPGAPRPQSVWARPYRWRNSREWGTCRPKSRSRLSPPHTGGRFPGPGGLEQLRPIYLLYLFLQLISIRRLLLLHQTPSQVQSRIVWKQFLLESDSGFKYLLCISWPVLASNYRASGSKPPRWYLTQKGISSLNLGGA